MLEDGQASVWFGTLVCLTLVWSMKAGIKPGLNLHLLGATTLTLMFGRHMALVGLSVVLAAVTANLQIKGTEAWQSYALNALVLAVFPVLLADAIRRFVERALPANFFIYVVVAAFFGAALTVTGAGLLSCALLWLAGVYPAATLVEDYFAYFILLGFSEAWMNGAAITLMVVYAPRWVGSFDDRRYLYRK